MEENMRQWVPLEGYEDIYAVNIFGQIKRFKKTSLYYKNNILASRVLKEIILKPILQKTGYYTVNLYKNSKLKTTSIHRIVAETFIPNALNKSDVNHKNGIKSDNFFENLEWLSKGENTKHAHDTGLIGQALRKGSGKLSDSDLIEIKKLLKSKITQKEIAKIFKVSASLINTIKSGKRFKRIKL